MTYLAAGAADIYLETGDRSLFEALDRLWDDMVATKLYITGGLGSRHSDEAIGDRIRHRRRPAFSSAGVTVRSGGRGTAHARRRVRHHDVSHWTL
ncbi:DUF1680 family protein [Streptosporangium album]|uniref:DUF1680 family protein n=1 Tax=Streptosporangium album TaxID=47479 RepID=A0A7W7RRN7_9ACTN|nr:DUF1680 family protein [Streptosporangium album]